MEKENTEKNIWARKHNGVRSVHTNQELIDLYTEPDITSEIAKGCYDIRTYGKNA